MDCGIATMASDCILTWRVCKITQATRRQWTESKSVVFFYINCSFWLTQELPISQTCGDILGYEIRITRSDNTTVHVNWSTSQPMNQLKCDEMQCHFTSLIKDATSVSLSAYNVHGTTIPSYLPKLVTGIRKPTDCSLLEPKNYSLKYHNNIKIHVYCNFSDVVCIFSILHWLGIWETWPALNLSMSLKDITVFWKVPPQFSNNLKEYVVQYKQAGAPLGHAFSWVKVNKSQTTAFFKGLFPL